jgi:hypothetical protein
MVVDVLCGSGSDDDPGDGPGGSPGDSPECEAMEAVLRQKAVMDARTAHAAAEFEDSGAWAPSGARTAKAWMTFACHLSPAEAGRHRNRGRALRHLPLVDEAFSAGSITGDHVDVFVGLDRGATKEALHLHEQLLVDFALTLTFAQFTMAIDNWRKHADPDGTTEAAEARRNRRKAYLSRGLDGMWVGQLNLDDVSGPIVHDEVERLEHLLFEADWAEATERLGRMPLTSELRRTSTQRMVDAFTWMARRSASRPAGSTKPTPLFNVHVDYDTMHGALCEMEDGTPVAPGQLLSWLDDADIVRVRHDPEGPVTMSHAMRLKEVTIRCFEQTVAGAKDRKECNPTDRIFSGATRRAIEIRDQQCSHPYCDRPARYCQIDHIKPYSLGGLTTQDNGRLLCGWHNRWYFEHEQRYGLTGQPTDERNPPRRE